MLVLDRNRLTGGGISSGLDEALMLIQLLQGTVAAQEVQQNTRVIEAYLGAAAVADIERQNRLREAASASGLLGSKFEKIVVRGSPVSERGRSIFSKMY